MEVQADRVGLAKLQHARTLVGVLHPHHRLTGKIPNRVVRVSPEDTALLVPAVTSVQTETGKKTNGRGGSRKAGHVHRGDGLAAGDELVVVCESGSDRGRHEHIGEGKPLERTGPERVDDVTDATVGALVLCPLLVREVKLTSRAKTVVPEQTSLSKSGVLQKLVLLLTFLPRNKPLRGRKLGHVRVKANGRDGVVPSGSPGHQHLHLGGSDTEERFHRSVGNHCSVCLCSPSRCCLPCVLVVVVVVVVTKTKVRFCENQQ